MAQRQRGDSNPCGQSPMDFESISLAARTHCLMPHERLISAKKEPNHICMRLTKSHREVCLFRLSLSSCAVVFVFLAWLQSKTRLLISGLLIRRPLHSSSWNSAPKNARYTPLAPSPPLVEQRREGGLGDEFGGDFDEVDEFGGHFLVCVCEKRGRV